jgi:hypothetical protein
MKLLIKYACRGRFNMLEKNLKEIKKNIKLPDTKILLSLDLDDNKIFNKSKLNELKPNLENVKVMISNSHNKIHALNRDLESLDWDYVLFITDYTEIFRYGFDEWILEKFENKTKFPDINRALKMRSKNTNGIEHHFLWVVPYSFYWKNKYVFNPKLAGNFHFELLEKELKKEHAIITDSISENAIHKYVHPKWGYYEKDELNMKSLSYWKTDYKAFENAILSI